MGVCSSSNKKNLSGHQCQHQYPEAKPAKPQEEAKKALAPLETKKQESHHVYNTHHHPHQHTHQPGVGDGSNFSSKLDKGKPLAHQHHRDATVKTAKVETKLFLQKEPDGLVHKVPVLEEGLKDSSIVRRRLSSNSPNQSAGTIAEASPERA